ncbi:hypothetical protein SPRG_06123 [Saprolegnia parasitica CBS 223.65]|uniref:SUEL-type lectin domain-containing protein n=1 Tax=Saprolegnia parasitica (strain CBS 223.65) TaxID=695850 RepID=A0A067CEY8_SAPPC|nr:hypothetical protein SPRG_06123 [Saprolegnia parasitica CBS 223.65]KDO29068.1 hypothetical protein SPRG_06123 [Saprolegnia parasitica CBS 223.65]|eukprot:XP_012200238.1 hypothetical protein SPRG_06123 [Saprolegnia parasitica CBS 223.65]
MGNNNSSPPPPPPAPTAPPTPALTLTSGATLLTQTTSQGNDPMRLDCGSPTLQISRVIFASYGTPSGSGLGAKFGTCFSGVSQKVVTSACAGLQACNVAVNNGNFGGDPCPGTAKRLTTWAHVAEHETLNLKCANGYVIASVDYASYGLPTAAYTNGWCHAASSVNVLTQLCVGQASCAVPAKNALFVDPCVGTFKALAAKVTCKQGTAPDEIWTPFVPPSCTL